MYNIGSSQYLYETVQAMFKISFHTNLSIIHANIRNHKFGQFPSFSGLALTIRVAITR